MPRNDNIEWAAAVISLLFILFVLSLNLAFLYLVWKLGWAAVAFLSTH